MSFKIYNLADDDVVDYPFKLIPHFPGGEPHVLVEPKYISGQDLWVDARVHNGQEFMSLLCLLDAITYNDPKSLSLFIPYFPGARQDRYEGGSCFTLGVYADCLRRFNLKRIVVVDCHSKATVQVLGSVCEQVTNVEVHHVFNFTNKDYSGVIRPDKGAEDRVNAASEHWGIGTTIRCDKIRNPKTGQLTGFTAELVNPDRRYLVLDDICDGGGTFLGLADQIRKNVDAHGGGDYTLHFCVTHGIFSKGTLDLLGEFGKIYTTDSFHNHQGMGEFLEVTNLFWTGLKAMRGTFDESNVAN